MTSKITSKPVSKHQPFITREELDQLEAFDKTLAVFERDIQSLTPFFLNSDFAAAEQAYSSNPTPKNFAAFRQTGLAVGQVERHVLPDSVLNVVENARNKFVEQTVTPFVRPILERGLSEAKQRLDEIVAEEQERHRDLTHSDLTHSGIVDCAKKPVAELERLLALIRQPRRAQQREIESLKKITRPVSAPIKSN